MSNMSTSGYDEGLSTLGAIAQDYGVNLSSAEEYVKQLGMSECMLFV